MIYYGIKIKVYFVKKKTILIKEKKEKKKEKKKKWLEGILFTDYTVHIY